MATVTAKPREFWVIKNPMDYKCTDAHIYDNQPWWFSEKDGGIHVIEYGAYEQAVKERDDWRDKKLNAVRHDLIEENERLKAALREIAEWPLKDDAREFPVEPIQAIAKRALSRD